MIIRQTRRVRHSLWHRARAANVASGQVVRFLTLCQTLFELGEVGRRLCFVWTVLWVVLRADADLRLRARFSILRWLFISVFSRTRNLLLRRCLEMVECHVREILARSRRIRSVREHSAGCTHVGARHLSTLLVVVNLGMLAAMAKVLLPRIHLLHRTLHLRRPKALHVCGHFVAAFLVSTEIDRIHYLCLVGSSWCARPIIHQLPLHLMLLNRMLLHHLLLELLLLQQVGRVLTLSLLSTLSLHLLLALRRGLRCSIPHLRLLFLYR